MIMTRITSNMVRRNYQNNLTHTLGGLESARKQVETGRRFSQSWEDPNAAAKAAILERRYARVEDQLSNVDFAQKWQDVQEDVVGSLSTMATIVAKDYSVRDVNGTNIAIESRSAYAQGLRSMQEQMVTTLNAKYGDTFVLAGNEGKSPPFAINEDGYLTYRGKPVKDIEEGDPLLNEHGYIDLGFGLDVERTQAKDANGRLAFRDATTGKQIYQDETTKDYYDADGNPMAAVDATKLTAVYDTTVAPASAFDTALPGIKLIGFGTITVETGGYVQETDQNGKPMFDQDGNPVYKKQNVQKTDKSGNPLYTSADGNNTQLYMKDGKYYEVATNKAFTPAQGEEPVEQYVQATDADGKLSFDHTVYGRVYQDVNGDFYDANGNQVTITNQNALTPVYETENVPETKEISRNLVDLCGELARVMELPEGEFTYDEYAIYWDEFTDGANKLRDQFAALGTKTQLLTATKSRLENEKLAIQTQYDDAVGIEPAEAIMNYSWANYAYNSALKVGASLITPSLLDFIN